MKVKNVLSVVFGLVLLIGSGVLFAFQSGEGENPEKSGKLKITIVKDNNGSLQKSEEIIEVKSRKDVKTYLKSKDIDLSELNFYGKKPSHHGHPRHGKMRVYNAPGKPMGDAHKIVFIKNDVNIEENSNSNNKEKVIVNTFMRDDSESGESQEVKIEKVVDKDGNIEVHKWVNGEEVDPNTKAQNHRMFMENGDGEMIIKVVCDEGDSDKIIKIKKEIDEDGNITILKSVNGEGFEKVEGGYGKYKCSKNSQKSGAHACKKGGAKSCGPRHGGAHGSKGFAARSNDGLVMIFGVPVDEKGNDISKKVVQEEAKSDLLIEDVTFYPNPTESQFSIAFNYAEKGKIFIQVKDMQGKEILNQEFNHEGGQFKEELELKDAESGMYIFNVTQNEKTYTHKLMVR